MKELTISLSEDSLKAAQRWVSSYAASLDARLDDVCKELAEVGEKSAKAHAPADHGLLESSIHTVPDKRGYRVVADAVDGHGHAYAAFVEFGTGVVGSGTYPGDLPAGYSYDSGRSPWAHEGDGWFYWSDNAHDYVFTEGHAAQPFMLPAMADMRARVAQAARRLMP